MDGRARGRAARRHASARRAARVRAATTSAFVTGGSGFIGGALVRRLVAEGWAVRALARSDASADAASRERGAEPVRGDLDDVGGDARRRGAAASSPSTAPRTSATGARARTSSAATSQGTRNALAGRARRPASGASSTSAPRPRCWPASRWSSVDERAPLRFDSPALYCATKARAEEAVLEATATASRPWSCARGSSGAAATRRSCRRMTAMVRAGRFAWIGGGRHLTSTTHVDNVVEGLLLGAERGAPGRRLLRHRRRAGRLPRVRHAPARHPGRRRRPDRSMPAPVAQRGRAAGETAWRAAAAARPAAADAPGRLALRPGGDDRHHTRAHRARLRAGQDHRRGDGGAERSHEDRRRVGPRRVPPQGARQGARWPRRATRSSTSAPTRRESVDYPRFAEPRRPPGRRRRGRARRPRLRLGRRRRDRRQQGRGRARRQRARRRRGRDGAPPQRRQRRDAVRRAAGPERGRRDRPTRSCAPSSRAAATPAVSARSSSSNATWRSRLQAVGPVPSAPSRLAPWEEPTSGERRHQIAARLGTTPSSRPRSRRCPTCPRLLQPPARRGRSRDRRRAPPRARAPAAHARDDRLARTSSRRPSSSARAAC